MKKNRSILLWASLLRQNPDKGMGIPLKKYPESRGKIFLKRPAWELKVIFNNFLNSPLYGVACFIDGILNKVMLVKVLSCFYEYQLFPFFIKYTDENIEDLMLQRLKKDILQLLFDADIENEGWLEEIKKYQIEHFKNNINKILNELIKPLPNQKKHNLLGLNLKQLAWLFFLNDLQLPSDKQYDDFLQKHSLSKEILPHNIKQSYLSQEISNALNKTQERQQEERQQEERQQEERQQLRRERIKYITKIILFAPIVLGKSIISDLKNDRIKSYFLKIIPFAAITAFYLEPYRYLLGNLFASVRNILEWANCEIK